MNRLPSCLITVWSAFHEKGLIIGPGAKRIPSPARARQGVPQNRAVELLQQALEPVVGELELRLSRYAPHRVGIFLGSSTGGIDRTERAYLEFLARGTMPETYSFEMSHSHQSLIEEIRSSLRISGPGHVVSTACSSTAKSLATAQRWLALGLLDAAVVGGADSKNSLTRLGFRSLNLVDPEGCRPFDATRRGLELGEGAAVLLLERERSAEGPVAYLRAVGESNDAYDLTAPDPDGRGAELAMRRALDIAGANPGDVDYINAHGTGTKQNDLSETRAIARVFGERTPFSSTKSTTGHLLGTAGALEAVLCIEALFQQTAPANRKPQELDQSLARQPHQGGNVAPLETALSNSFAFGGSNASVLLARAPNRADAERPRVSVYLMKASHSLDENFRAKGRPSVLPARVWSRASPLTRLVSELFAELGENSDNPAVILGSAFGEMSTTMNLLAQLAREDQLSPLRFPSSVHNTAVGILTQLTQNRGYATALAAGSDTVVQALADALVYLECHGGEALTLIADEEGPRALLGGKTFPTLGVGFHLVAAESAPQEAWALIEGIRSCPSSRGPSIPDALRGVPSPADGPIDQAPAAFALELAHRVMTEEKLFEVLDHPIGPRWTLRLRPPRP